MHLVRSALLFCFLSFSSVSHFHFVSNANAEIPTSASKIVLKELFLDAQKFNPTFQIKQEQSSLSESTYKTTRSALLPGLSAGYSWLWQDRPASSSSTANTRSQTGKLSLTQPLFRGLGEFSALESARKDWTASELQVAWERLQLYLRVVDLAIAYQTALENYRITSEQKSLSEGRLKEIKERNRIGKSKRADVFSAEAQWYQTQAAEESAKAEWYRADQKMEEVIGKTLNGGEINLKSTGTSSLNSLPKSEGEWTLLLEKRLDWKAQVAKLDSTESTIWVAKSGHLPKVDFSGNYYWYRSNPGTSRGVDWDAGVTLSFPLFSGFATQSAIQSSVIKTKIESLNLDTLKNKIKSEVQGTYSLLEGTELQVNNLTQALRAAEANYNEQRRDDRLGIATNLDVIAALNQLADIKRSLSRTLLQKEELKIQWQVLTGQETLDFQSID